jgi:hypothetical protein
VFLLLLPLVVLLLHNENAWTSFQSSGPSRQNSQKRPEPGSRNLFLRADQDMRNAIIFMAKHPRARLSSGRSNERVDDIPTQRPFTAKLPEETRTRFSQSLPSGQSRHAQRDHLHGKTPESPALFGPIK